MTKEEAFMQLVASDEGAARLLVEQYCITTLHFKKKNTFGEYVDGTLWLYIKVDVEAPVKIPGMVFFLPDEVCDILDGTVMAKNEYDLLFDYVSL